MSTHTQIGTRTRPHPRRWALSAAAVLLAVPLAGCSVGAEEQIAVPGDDRFDLSGESVRVGTAAETPLDVGTSYAVSLLDSWGADVQREELTDISGLQAVVADRIDVAARSSDEVVDARSQDIDLVAFGAPASSMHYVIIGSPDVESIADLEGRSIATSGPGGFDTSLFDALLAEEGLTRGEDVEEITIGGSSERTASLVADQADASMVFLDDWLALSQRTDSVVLTAYVEDLLPGLSARTLAAPRVWLEAHEELATAMACANLEANQWITEDGEGFTEATVDRVTGVDPEAIDLFRDEALDLNMFPTEPADLLNPEQYETTAEVMLAGGAIDEAVDLSEAVDTSYVEEAAAQGCGTD